MGKTKKAFIDRKNAVTFRLVHRSQHDPLITDEAAPQHVLVEAGVRQPQKSNELEEVDAAQRKMEQRKYGIHFDDDYNYLQHLKKPEQQIVWEYMENPNQVKKRIEKGELTTAPKLFLPSSVFATEYEEEEGMLNKAAPQPGPHPEWDPDVIACLDGDFDFDNEDNQLEDDFVMKAMNDESDETEASDHVRNGNISNFDEDYLTDEENCSDLEDVEDEIELLNKFNSKEFRNEETKSRFTEYSMSSSVLPRNEQLRLLDDRFERFYATYDDSELGDLSTEEIQGHWHQNYPYIEGCMLLTKKPEEDIKYDKKWDKKRLKKYRYVSADEPLDTINEYIEMEVPDPNEKKWDCESILSTYSNLYNHPKVIDETKGKLPRKLIKNLPPPSDKINIDAKSGIPTDVLRGDNNLNAKTLAKLDNNNSTTSYSQALCAKSLISTLSVLSIRPKDELPEEKRERKRLIKEYRNERRIERKTNTLAFKEEKKRQIQVKINQRLNQNGTKIL